MNVKVYFLCAEHNVNMRMTADGPITEGITGPLHQMGRKNQVFSCQAAGEVWTL